MSINFVMSQNFTKTKLYDSKDGTLLVDSSLTNIAYINFDMPATSEKSCIILNNKYKNTTYTISWCNMM